MMGRNKLLWVWVATGGMLLLPWLGFAAGEQPQPTVIDLKFGDVRVPDEYAKAADAEVIIRLQTAATGKLEVKRKLSELPKSEPNGLLRLFFGSKAPDGTQSEPAKEAPAAKP